MSLVEGEGHLADGIAAILFACDPVDLGRGTNSGEYRHEAKMIAARLAATDAPATDRECLDIVYEVFCEMLGTAAGRRELYVDAAHEVLETARRRCEGS